MTPAAPSSPAASPWTAMLTWLRSVEAWLDARGRWAWIATMVAGFIIAPPLGLLVLGYMIWSKRMFGHCSHQRRAGRGFGFRFARDAMRPSGNSAFDAYKADTLRRLNDEQQAFDAFLTRLREARDKTEFDRFMEEQANRVNETRDVAPGDGAATTEAGDDGQPRRGMY